MNCCANKLVFFNNEAGYCLVQFTVFCMHIHNNENPVSVNLMRTRRIRKIRYKCSGETY